MSETKIDWDAKLTNFDGEELKKNNKPDSPAATLRFLVCQAIDAQLPEDRDLKKGEKKDRAYLMKQLRRPDVAPLSNKDTEFIKNRIEAVYSSWVVGECLDLLEGKNGDAPKAAEPAKAE